MQSFLDWSLNIFTCILFQWEINQNHSENEHVSYFPYTLKFTFHLQLSIDAVQGRAPCLGFYLWISDAQEWSCIEMKWLVWTKIIKFLFISILFQKLSLVNIFDAMSYIGALNLVVVLIFFWNQWNKLKSYWWKCVISYAKSLMKCCMN